MMAFVVIVVAACRPPQFSVNDCVPRFLYPRCEKLPSFAVVERNAKLTSCPQDSQRLRVLSGVPAGAHLGFGKKFEYGSPGGKRSRGLVMSQDKIYSRLHSVKPAPRIMAQ